MNEEAATRARYFAQLAELGGPELYLESLDRRTALEAMSGRRPVSAPAANLRRGRAESDGVASRTDSPVRAAPVRELTIRKPSPEALTGLEVLSAKAAGCTLCGLHARRQQVVFGEGSAAADLVVVGEAPGQEEDRTGRPFVGRAGRLLDLLLMSAGFPRDQVYICNVLKCRPPNNRNPEPAEMDMCTRNYLHGQLELIAPRALLAVGRFAVQALLESSDAIGRLRGRLHAYRGTPLIVSYHPAYLLRSPNMVRAAWSDYQLARTVLDEQV